MKKLISLLLVLTFLISSCSKEVVEENVDNTNTKKDFIIETKKLNTFSKNTSINKTWKIVSASDLTITSQASWKVAKINFKEWDKVYKWQSLVNLEDNISNYSINLERSQNTLEKTKINYESSLLTLNKTISDYQIAYDKAKINHESLVKDLDIQAQKVKYDYNVSGKNQSISQNKNDLDIDKLEQNYEKQLFDYNNSIISDNNTLSTYKESIVSTKKSIDLLFYDVINYIDEIYWVSEKNKNKNDSFEMFLSAKDSTKKYYVEEELKKYIWEYETFKKLSINIENDQDYDTYLNKIESIILWLKKLTDLAKDSVKDSVSWDSFTQTNIDTYYSTINNYSSSLQTQYSTFSTLKSNIQSFLNTYLTSRESKQKALDLLSKDIEITKKQLSLSNLSSDSSLETSKTTYERTLLDIENTKKNSEIWLKTALNNLENAIKNKEITLKSLQNSIKEAEVSLSESQKNYSKLNITSPIDWVVSVKNVDLWQEVSVWTSLLTIVSDNKTEIELYLTSDEVKYLKEKNQVKVSYLWKELSWYIGSISSVAQKDFTYKVLIVLTDKVSIIWDFVEVTLPINLENILLPINALKIVWWWDAIVYVLNSENKIEEKNIKVWNVFWEYIELLDNIPLDLDVIITDVKNYNSDEFELKVK